MRVDIWTIHEQILGGGEWPRQLDGQRSSPNWPVGIPPKGAGLPSESHSWVCGLATGPDDFNNFKADIVKFRQWMVSKGYGHAVVDLRIWRAERRAGPAHRR